jgi:hypothetical protein
VSGVGCGGRTRRGHLAQRERRGERGEKASPGQRLLAGRDALEEHRELVGGHARHRVAPARQATETLGHLAEQPVRRVVAVHRVDRPEPVEVEEEHRRAVPPGVGGGGVWRRRRRWRAGGARPRDRVGKPGGQGAAVRGPGEGVPIGRGRSGGVAPPLGRHVARVEDDQPAGRGHRVHPEPPAPPGQLRVGGVRAPVGRRLPAAPPHLGRGQVGEEIPERRADRRRGRAVQERADARVRHDHAPPRVHDEDGVRQVVEHAAEEVGVGRDVGRDVGRRRTRPDGGGCGHELGGAVAGAARSLGPHGG